MWEKLVSLKEINPRKTIVDVHKNIIGFGCSKGRNQKFKKGVILEHLLLYILCQQDFRRSQNLFLLRDYFWAEYSKLESYLEGIAYSDSNHLATSVGILEGPIEERWSEHQEEICLEERRRIRHGKEIKWYSWLGLKYKG